MATVVWFVASAAAIASAFAVILQRNPFISAIALLGNLASLATLFVLLQSDFVAAAQIIVYAGAVMVMFLFVIAYIGPRGELPSEHRRLWQIVVASVAGGRHPRRAGAGDRPLRPRPARPRSTTRSARRRRSASCS